MMMSGRTVPMNLADTAIKVNRNKLVIGGLSLILYVLFELSFVEVIQYNYAEFEKFHVGDAGNFKILFSYAVPVVFTLLLILLPCSKLIYTILVFMLVIIIYPSSILARQINSDFRILLLQSIYFLSVYLIANHFRIRIKLPAIVNHQKTWFLLAIAIILITPFVIIFGPHVDYRNFLLENVYESRAVEASLTNTYTAYLYAPLSNVILPLLLVMAFLNREFFKAVLALTMLLFMFLVGAHKSVFFGIFLLFYFSFGSYYTKLIFFLSGILFFFLVSLLTYYWINDLFLTSLINRRVFFLPAILDVGYFDYFDNRPLVWSESIFKSFLTYPYDLPAKNIISEYVTGDVTSNANNGIISDGFMNYGFAGGLINIFFVSIVYGILNSLNIHHRFFGIIFLLFFTFYSSFFFTSMLTQGGILLLIIAYFFLKDTAESKRY